MGPGAFLDLVHVFKLHPRVQSRPSHTVDEYLKPAMAPTPSMGAPVIPGASLFTRTLFTEHIVSNNIRIYCRKQVHGGFVDVSYEMCYSSLGLMLKSSPSVLVAGVLVASSPEAVEMCSDALRVSPSCVMISVMVATRRRLKHHRRFSTFVGDVGMTICDTCVQLDNTLYQVQDNVSGPTYQMVSPCS